MIRSLFAGHLQIGEEKGRKWRESLYERRAMSLILDFLYSLKSMPSPTNPKGTDKE